MKANSREGISALVLAISSAAALGGGAAAQADTFTINTSTATLIENSNFSGATRITAEGAASGASANFLDYSIIDFSTGGLLPAQTQANSINSITLNLVDKAEGFAVAGTVDVYVTTFTGPTSGLVYQTAAAAQPQGIGNALDTLYPVGQISYTKTVGSVYNLTLNLSNTALQSYVLGQINTGGKLRFAVADDAPNVAADFEGTAGTATLAPPSLSLNLATGPLSTGNALFNLSAGAGSNATGSGKSITFTVDRMLNTATASTNITVTNNGTDPGSYSLTSSSGTTNTLSAAAVGTIGTEPVPAGGVSNITVGIAPSGVLPGLTQTGPATATVTIKNLTNSGDGDAVVTITANQVVGTRFVNNIGSNGTPVKFGKILSGTSAAAQVVTFDTENTSAFDLTSQSLTSVTMLAGTSLTNASLSSAIAGTNDTVSVAPGAADVLFNDGSVTTTRNVSFKAGTVGGLYETKSFFDGFAQLPMLNSDTALGSANTTARIYVEADVYQPALVTSLTIGNTTTLTNTKHTVNTASTALGDIGARAAAQVTSVSLVNAQAGYAVDAGLVPGVTIADGATVNATTFASTGKLNGTYVGTLQVGLQNEQDIAGAAPNDLGTKTVSLSTTVSGNTGTGTANILAGGSFAGYNISRGSGKNSLITFLAGTSTSGNNITVNWNNGTPLSDLATLSATSTDLYVVQMTYDQTAVTNGTTSPVLASGTGAASVFANTGGTPLEINGAYDGNLTLGHYGVDTVNHTVWAVVNHAGTFEASQRLIGDANGDGTVNNLDLQIVLTNFGTAAGTWSAGNFTGGATIDLNDLADVLNHMGAGSAGLNADAGTSVPEPASLVLLALGVPALTRRRSRC